MSAPPQRRVANDEDVASLVSAGGRVAAFFDMDHTVVRGNTGAMYIKDVHADGEITSVHLARLSFILLRYKLAMVDMHRVLATVATALQGQSVGAVQERCDRLFESTIRPLVSDAAVEAIRAHQRLGHEVVMLTAQTPYIAAPVCKLLEIDHWLCTRLEENEQGEFTGRLVGPACYGEGKYHWASQFAEAHGVDLSRSYFYTDSYSDMPMLEVVGHKRVVSPDPRLRLEASRRGWTVLRFES